MARYQRLTSAALAVVDHVVLISAHSRDEALAEELVEPGRASVVHIAVNHSLADAGVLLQSSPPAPGPTGAIDVILWIASYRLRRRGQQNGR